MLTLDEICKKDPGFRCNPIQTYELPAGVNPNTGEVFVILEGCQVTYDGTSIFPLFEGDPDGIALCDFTCGRGEVYLIEPILPPVKARKGVRKRDFLVRDPDGIMETTLDETIAVARARSDESKGLATVKFL